MSRYAGQLGLFDKPQPPAKAQAIAKVRTTGPTLIDDLTEAPTATGGVRTKVSRQNSHATNRPHRPLKASLTAFHLCVLGSGSGGNATAVRCGDHAMLIDAGFGPVTINRRLQQIGLSLKDLRAVCLTHLDQDHFRPHWVRTLLNHSIRVHLHAWHVRYLERVPGAADLFATNLVNTFESETFEPLPGLSAQSVTLPHDDKGTSAFHLECEGRRVGYATDLGHVPAELIDAFAGVDILLLESNYDPHMQRTSSRPYFLKQRIMGKHGHLSNEQAFDAVRRIADAGPRGNPQRVVLLHRSAQCNTPELTRRAFESDARFAERLTLTHQRRRSPLIDVQPLGMLLREQRKLFAARIG